MKRSFLSHWKLVKQSFMGCIDHDAMIWCAALAYFAIFSLGPLFLILMSSVGFFFSESTVEKELLEEVTKVVGAEGARMLRTIIAHSKKPMGGSFSAYLGGITFFLSAIGIFAQLQAMLNRIWGVEIKPNRGLINILRSRLINFCMIGIIAFLLLGLLIASTALSSLVYFFSEWIPIPSYLFEISDFTISFILMTLLFAFIFKVLPDVEIRWRNVWMGSLITSLLFSLGKSLISIYIAMSATSVYGAASSLVILLLWIYTSLLIFFFGAEFTKAYSLLKGDKIIPTGYARLKRPLHNSKG